MRSHIVIASVCLLVLTARVSAQSVELPLTDDTFINGNDPATAFGDTSEPLYVHTWGPKHVLLQFDAAQIAGATVEEATLLVPLTDLQSAGVIDVYAVTTAWNESTASYDNQPTAEAVAAASRDVDMSNVGQAAIFDLTGVVQRWADGSLPAAGVLLVSSDPLRALFESKEIGVGAQLDVDIDRPLTSDRQTIDLSSAPVEIDEPGYYELDRDWHMGTEIGQIGTLVTVTANDVTLDFRGYEVTFEHNGTGIRVNGGGFTVRNGRLAGDLDSYALYSEAARTTIDHMQIYSREGIHLSGDNAVVTDSAITGRFGTVFGNDGLAERSSFGCFASCMSLNGNNSKVVGNRIDAATGYAIAVRGGGSVVADNVFDSRNADTQVDVIQVLANDNQVLRNTLLLYGDEGVLVDVQGTRNTVVGNVAAPSVVTGGLPSVGIRFTVDGNWYGDNRVTATTPFDLGGTTQTDWGGNVSF